MAHTFNPSTEETEIDKPLSSKPAQATQCVPVRQSYTVRPCLKKENDMK